MKNFLRHFDPYEQSPFFFHWGFWSVLVVAGACFWGISHWDGAFMKASLDNVFVYLPNYLIHEMVGHNLVGRMGRMICHNSCPAFGEWWGYAMGNGVETFIPLSLSMFCLRIKGGRMLLPGIWYWLGCTLYGAGIYAADARACALPLTLSDMMTNYPPGVIKGDWHYILQPLGLLNYDIVIGHILTSLGIICLVIAVYSMYYYWTHAEQFLYNER